MNSKRKKKITKEELKKLNEFSNNYFALKNKMGDLEISSQEIELEKIKTFQMIRSNSSKFSEFKSELTNNYGNIKINIDNGSIIYDETE